LTIYSNLKDSCQTDFLKMTQLYAVWDAIKWMTQRGPKHKDEKIYAMQTLILLKFMQIIIFMKARIFYKCQTTY
jgi:hypothetical protein